MNPSTIWLFALIVALPTDSQQRTIHKVEGKLMAPCCYSQTIDVHDSEVAQQMRGEVTAMVLAGKSETEILDYYKAEYGESILAVPDGRAGTLVFSIPTFATLFALLALLCGMVITVRRQPRTVSVAPPGLDEASLLALHARIRNEWSNGT